MRMHCPYCGDDDLDWSRVEDAVYWGGVDCGTISTIGLRCLNPICKGSKGFTAEFGFIVDDAVTYSDENGDEIEEPEED